MQVTESAPSKRGEPVAVYLRSGHIVKVGRFASRSAGVDDLVRTRGILLRSLLGPMCAFIPSALYISRMPAQVTSRLPTMLMLSPGGE